MSNTKKKMDEDVLYYWHYMQQFWDQQSLMGQTYVLQIVMGTFLKEATNPRVIKLLSEFRKAKSIELGVAIDDGDDNDPTYA
jgi:hypothetical protein